jgi:hypothetical protein
MILPPSYYLGKDVYRGHDGLNRRADHPHYRTRPQDGAKATWATCRPAGRQRSGSCPAGATRASGASSMVRKSRGGQGRVETLHNLSVGTCDSHASLRSRSPRSPRWTRPTSARACCQGRPVDPPQAAPAAGTVDVCARMARVTGLRIRSKTPHLVARYGGWDTGMALAPNDQRQKRRSAARPECHNAGSCHTSGG